MQEIEIVNLVPKFLTFFEYAKHKGMDEERRWHLWKEHYNFVALPPGYDQTARNQLNQTWKKYQKNIEQIQDWEPDKGKTDMFLKEIKTLLGCTKDIPFVLLFFVGTFNNNAFVAPYNESKMMLCLPIEQQISDIVIAHELTHIVHAETACLEMNWKRPLAELILQEGLALQASKYIVPGRNDEAYIEMGMEEGWLETCYKHKAKILNGIIPYLSEERAEVLEKFVFGSGTAGQKREAYFAGWEFVDSELKKGITFSELASMKQKDIPSYVKNNIL